MPEITNRSVFVNALTIPAFALLALIFFQSGVYGQTDQKNTEQLISSASAEFTFENRNYVIVDGSAYEIDEESGRSRFVTQLYEPGYILKNYREQDGVVYRIVPDSSQSYPVITGFFEGFEGANELSDLIGIERGWTSLTLLSAAAPTVADYVALRQKILRGQLDFIDNRIEPSIERPYQGLASLRAFAPVSPGPVTLTKASLSTELLYFDKGDDFWFSAMFYIENGMPTSLVDLEADYITNGPGMRLMVSPEGKPRLELKWADKPTYRLNMGVSAKLPVGEWFRIDMHFMLSDTQEGLAELWLDGELIISANGQTLPMSDTVLTRLEVGITANRRDVAALLYIDELAFSNTGPIQN